jgi:hypothetical protein
MSLYLFSPWFQAFIGEPYYTDIARDRKISTIQMIGNAGGLVGTHYIRGKKYLFI